jgi:hypothetical protein
LEILLLPRGQAEAARHASSVAHVPFANPIHFFALILAVLECWHNEPHGSYWRQLGN